MRAPAVRRAATSLAVVASVAVVLGCGDSSTQASSDSGITGTVTVGPTCPGPSNATNPQSCTAPLAVELVIADAAGGNEVARTSSDDAGEYTVDLAPGSYRITPDRPGAAPVNVTVSPHSYSKLDILLDSGVR